MHFHTLLSKANIMVYTGAIWWPKRGIFINIALYIYTGGICQLQFLNLLHCFAFFCVWNNSANASERQMQKISVYVMVHVSGGGGGGGGICMGFQRGVV